MLPCLFCFCWCLFSVIWLQPNLHTECSHGFMGRSPFGLSVCLNIVCLYVLERVLSQMDESMSVCQLKRYLALRAWMDAPLSAKALHTCHSADMDVGGKYLSMHIIMCQNHANICICTYAWKLMSPGHDFHTKRSHFFLHCCRKNAMCEAVITT